jgi:hypothetical protein
MAIASARVSMAINKRNPKSSAAGVCGQERAGGFGDPTGSASPGFVPVLILYTDQYEPPPQLPVPRLGRAAKFWRSCPSRAPRSTTYARSSMRSSIWAANSKSRLASAAQSRPHSPAWTDARLALSPTTRSTRVVRSMSMPATKSRASWCCAIRSIFPSSS